MKRAAAGLIALLAGLVLASSAPIAATAAGEVPTVEFSNLETSADFGSNWLITLNVRSSAADYPRLIDSSSGVVDVYIEGIAGAFAEGLPVQAGGIAYLSQAADRPNLAAGTYVLSAIFRPAAGSQLETAQTTKPAALTIASYPISASASVIGTPTESEPLQILALLTGSVIKETGVAPVGLWQFTVTDDRTGAEIAEGAVAQPAKFGGPLVMETEAGIFKPSSNYTLKVTFTPHESLIGGFDVTVSRDIHIGIPARSFGGSLSATVDVPIATSITIAAFLLALIAGVIFLVVRSSRAKTVSRARDDTNAVAAVAE